MKTLSIDIAIYSDVPLQKTSVYRYVESPNFEILLFAYSIDSLFRLSTSTAENRFQKKSFSPWKINLSSNGPSTPPLNVSASLAS